MDSILKKIIINVYKHWVSTIFFLKKVVAKTRYYYGHRELVINLVNYIESYMVAIYIFMLPTV